MTDEQRIKKHLADSHQKWRPGRAAVRSAVTGITHVYNYEACDTPHRASAKIANAWILLMITHTRENGD